MKSPRGVKTPNPTDRSHSLYWLSENLVDNDPNMNWESWCVMFVYVTNTIDELDETTTNIVNVIEHKLYMSVLKKQVSIDDLEKKITDLSTGLGSQTRCLKEWEQATAFWKRNSVKKRYALMFIVLKGVPYLVFNIDGSMFPLDGKMLKLYTHYKRNPTYDYATYSTQIDGVDHVITCVVDGSSDTDISRLFWNSGRNKNCKLIPIEHLKKNAFDLNHGGLFQKLLETTGKVQYIIDFEGEKNATFKEVINNVVTTQEKLWKQSKDNRALIEQSGDAIINEMNFERIYMEILDNYQTRNRGSIIRCKNTCSGVNETYEQSQYEVFNSGAKHMYYISAYPLEDDNVSRNKLLAFIFVKVLQEDEEVEITLFCKNNQFKESKASRYIFAYTIKWLSERYNLIHLEALPMAVPFYEAYGFIKTNKDDRWTLPVQKGHRSVKRLFDPNEANVPKKKTRWI